MIWTRSSRNLKKSLLKTTKRRSRLLKFAALLAMDCGLSACLIAAEHPPADYPVYVAQLANLNDYNVFANSGWDGNWYVGYDTCWIKKLPPVPPGRYRRAFLGARLGRAKLEPP